MLLWMDDVEVLFGLHGIATNGDWQHDRTLRSQACHIARGLLARHGAHAGEGWKIVLGVDGKTTVKRLW